MTNLKRYVGVIMALVLVISAVPVGTVGATAGGAVWSYNTGDYITGSPSIANGIVFIGNGAGDVYAINADTGNNVWSRSLGSSEIDTAPAVANGTVYFGVGNTLYALDQSTGNTQWSYSTGGAIHSSPTVYNGMVYVGSDDNKVHAVNIETGNAEWTFSTGNYVHTSPTVVNGTVYIGNDDGTIFALDASTGAKDWQYSTGSRVQSSPTVWNGTVYVGSGNNNLYAINADTGNVEWTYSTGGKVISSPTVDNGTVYVGSYDGNLYAVNANTGSMEWKYSMQYETIASPTVAGGTVYVGDSVGTLYAVDASTGSGKWTYSGGGAFDSSPTVANGTLYVGNWDNNVYAIDLSHTGNSVGTRVKLGTLGMVGDSYYYTPPTKVYDSPDLSINTDHWMRANQTINISVSYNGTDVSLSNDLTINSTDPGEVTITRDAFGNGNIAVTAFGGLKGSVFGLNFTYEDTSANEIHYKNASIGVGTYKHTRTEIYFEEYMEFNSTQSYTVTYRGFDVTGELLTYVSSSDTYIAEADPTTTSLHSYDYPGNVTIRAEYQNYTYKYVDTKTLHVVEDKTNLGRFKFYPPSHMNYSETSDYFATFDGGVLPKSAYTIQSNNTDLLAWDPVNNVLEATGNTSLSGIVNLTATYERHNVTYTNSKVVTVGPYEKFNKPDINLTLALDQYFQPGETHGFTVYKEGSELSSAEYENATVLSSNTSLFTVNNSVRSVTATTSNIIATANLTVAYSGEYHTYRDTVTAYLNYQKTNLTAYAKDYFDYGDTHPYEVTYNGNTITGDANLSVFTNNTDLLAVDRLNQQLEATTNTSLSGTVEFRAEYTLNGEVYVDTKLINVGKLPDQGMNNNTLEIRADQYYLHGENSTYSVLFNDVAITGDGNLTVVSRNTTLFTVDQPTTQIIASSNTNVSGVTNITASYLFEGTVYMDNITVGLAHVERVDGGDDDGGRKYNDIITTFGVRGPNFMRPNSTAPISFIFDQQEITDLENVTTNSSNSTLVWVNKTGPKLVSIRNENASGKATITVSYIHGPTKWVDTLNVTVSPIDMEHYGLIPPFQRFIALLSNSAFQVVLFAILVGAPVSQKFGWLPGIIASDLVILLGLFMGMSGTGPVAIAGLMTVLLALRSPGEIQSVSPKQ